MGLLNLKELKSLLCPHYALNIILASLYLVTKLLHPFCSFMFPTSGCQLDFRETEILTFLAIIIVLRSRKQGATRIIPYLSSMCMYSKFANLILFFYSDPRIGIIYAVLCLTHLLLLPEPSYEGPDNVVYFTGPNLEEELQRDTRVTWVITFYTVWNAGCVNFAPVFAELSVKYGGLDNLKFGKLDATRFPDVANKFYVNTSAFSKQLPTVILFKGGKEVARRPTVDERSHLIKFFFSDENITSAFNLNNLYQECKSNPIKKPKKDEGVEHIKAE